MINARSERLLWVAIVSVVLTPLIISLGHGITDVLRSPVIWHESDNAGIEINTISACRGHQLLGVGSRFEWNHPGPIYFYLMAPIYVLAGKNASALSLAATIIALVFVIATLIAARRGTEWSSGTLAYCVGILLAVYLWTIPVDSIWNPHVLYVPFVLFLLLCGLLSIGRTWVLPGIVFVGSFLIQTHLGTAPCVMALAMISLTTCFSKGLRSRLGFTTITQGSSKIWLFVSLIILALAWFPPIMEELTHSPGNLTKLFHFFARRQDHHRLLEAFTSFSIQFSWLGLLFPDHAGSGMSRRWLEVISVVVAVFQLISLILVYRINVSKGQYFNASIAAITGIGSLFAVLSIVTIKGPIYGYLVGWMSGLGLTAYAVILSAVIDGLIRHARVFRRDMDWQRIATSAGIFLILGSIAVTLWGLSDLPGRMVGEFAPRCSSAEERRVKELSECLLSYLDAEKISRPLIRWDHNRWPTAIGVILQLAKSNKPFGQEGLFGDDYAVNGKQDAVIVIKGHVETVKSGYKLICSHAMPLNPKHDEFYGDTFIYRFDTTKK
ncbi:MAG: hypothetical protein M1511_11400 [Deltaproteobacteria bacterium]|nr:hypothetical protein [Deltaproteobacteria bacterium]